MHIDYIYEMEEYLRRLVEFGRNKTDNSVVITDSIRIVDDYGHKKLYYETKNNPNGIYNPNFNFSSLSQVVIPSIFLEKFAGGKYNDGIHTAYMHENGTITIRNGNVVVARICNEHQQYIESKYSDLYQEIFEKGVLPLSFKDNDDYDIMVRHSQSIVDANGNVTSTLLIVSVYNKQLGEFVYNTNVKVKGDYLWSTNFEEIYGDVDKSFSLKDVHNYLLNRNDSICNGDKSDTITSGESFMFVLKGMGKDDINNLCTKIQDYLGKDKISLDDCYRITQGDLKVDGIDSAKILELAYELLDEGKNLGDRLVGGYNTTDWISHSLNVGRCMEILASNLGLNSDFALSLGLIHDIGRKNLGKEKYPLEHVTKGYEFFMNKGYRKFARYVMTHSFIDLNRWCNCENADNDDNFDFDENDRPYFKEDSKKDLFTHMLERMNYNIYDIILNISDLMATNMFDKGLNGILSPEERVNDVFSRRSKGYGKKDYKKRKNGEYFYRRFKKILKKVYKIINMNDSIESEEFSSVSNSFYEMFESLYRDYMSKKKHKISR